MTNEDCNLDCICRNCLEEIFEQNNNTIVCEKMSDSKFLLTKLISFDKEIDIYELLQIPKLKNTSIDELCEMLIPCYNISNSEIERLIYYRYRDKMKEIYELSEKEFKYLTFSYASK